MDLATLVGFLGGLALLVAGAEGLVRGASRLARAAGISPLVVGLTVVAYGTSAPELAVTLKSVLAGQPDVAAGNVVGSNVFNVLFILGLSASITPLVVARQVVRLDVPILIGVSTLFLFFTLDGRVSRLEALTLSAGAFLYTWFLIRISRREQRAAVAAGDDPTEEPPLTPGRIAVQVGLLLGGLGLLVLGARWLVEAAITTAQALGVSELVIGLTIVAAGTSMPEVATSVVAALRGERDIAVGNVVGSCLFNLLAVLGFAGVAAGEIPVAPALLHFDIPVMLAVAVACLPICFTSHRISRWEGVLFFAYYIAYTGYLILDATGHDALPAFSAWMGWFVLPLTAITLLVLAWRYGQRTGWPSRKIS